MKGYRRGHKRWKERQKSRAKMVKQAEKVRKQAKEWRKTKKKSKSTKKRNPDHYFDPTDAYVHDDRDAEYDPYANVPLPTDKMRRQIQTDYFGEELEHIIFFTPEEVYTLEWVGDKYGWSSSASKWMRESEDGTYYINLNTHAPIEIHEGIEADMEGGHDAFPLLDTRSRQGSDLADKLMRIYDLGS